MKQLENLAMLRKLAIGRQNELSLQIQQSKRVIEASISVLFSTLNTPGHTRMGFCKGICAWTPLAFFEKILPFVFSFVFHRNYSLTKKNKQKSVGHVTCGN